MVHPAPFALDHGTPLPISCSRVGEIRQGGDGVELDWGAIGCGCLVCVGSNGLE